VAKLSIARKTLTEQRAKASKMRGLKTPDWKVGIFIGVVESSRIGVLELGSNGVMEYGSNGVLDAAFFLRY
jgi:hypothetical protein